MSLGPDHEICKQELVEAMRARLEADETGSGANVDRDDVKKNFDALGKALYQIATVQAQTASDSAADAVFWQWISDVQAWLKALSTWQQGVADAVAAWTPTLPAEQDLKNALDALAAPGAPPAAAPAALAGRIE